MFLLETSQMTRLAWPSSSLYIMTPVCTWGGSCNGAYGVHHHAQLFSTELLFAPDLWVAYFLCLDCKCLGGKDCVLGVFAFPSCLALFSFHGWDHQCSLNKWISEPMNSKFWKTWCTNLRKIPVKSGVEWRRAGHTARALPTSGSGFGHIACQPCALSNIPHLCKILDDDVTQGAEDCCIKWNDSCKSPNSWPLISFTYIVTIIVVPMIWLNALPFLEVIPGLDLQQSLSAVYWTPWWTGMKAGVGCTMVST